MSTSFKQAVNNSIYIFIEGVITNFFNFENINDHIFTMKLFPNSEFYLQNLKVVRLNIFERQICCGLDCVYKGLIDKVGVEQRVT